MPKMLRFPPGLRLASVSINPGRNRQTQEPAHSSASQDQPVLPTPPAQLSWEGASHREAHTGHHEGQEQQRDTFQPPRATDRAQPPPAF